MLVARALPYRLALSTVLFANLLSPASAGKLSAVRKEVRPSSDPPHHDHGKSDDDKSDTESDDDHHAGGRLSKARKKAGARRTRHGRRQHHHSHRRHGPFGVFPIVALNVVHVEESPPPDFVPPARSSPEPVTTLEPDEVFERFPPPVNTFFAVPYDLEDGVEPDWVARIGIEHGFATDNVERFGFTLLAEGAAGLGFLADFNSYTENLSGGGRDRLHFGDFDLLFRIAETEQARVHFGVGLSWLDDDIAGGVGGNVLLSADLFPRKPLVISGLLAWGTLGDAETFHTRATVGANWKNLEVFGGYDYRSVGSVSLHGPMVGLRFWF